MKVSWIVAGAVGLIVGLLIDHALFWSDDGFAFLFVVVCVGMAVVLAYLALHSRGSAHHAWHGGRKR
jgi:uncharacterized protein YacL